jgi:hypothetical protein
MASTCCRALTSSGPLSNDLPLPLPDTRVTSKLTDNQNRVDPRLTSELIENDTR